MYSITTGVHYVLQKRTSDVGIHLEQSIDSFMNFLDVVDVFFIIYQSVVSYLLHVAVYVIEVW